MKSFLLSLILHLAVASLLWLAIRDARAPDAQSGQVTLNSPGAQSPVARVPPRPRPAGTGPVGTLPASPPAGSSQNSVDSAANSYLLLIRQKIESHQTYPRSALRRGEEDTVDMKIEISDSGEVTGVEPISAQKAAFFVEAAREAILQSSPFPPPPPGFPRKIAIPVVFRISR